MQSGSHCRRKGIALILTAAMTAAMLPMLGLAMDASFLYAVKAKLSASVDAAALAGARSLNLGMDLSSQETSARTTAQQFFNANFPSGHLGTTNATFTANVAQTAYKTRTVTVTANVDAPSYFLRFLGFRNTHMVAEGTASRRDVNLELVLDRSGSMSGAMGSMKQAAIGFVNKFAEGRDNLGLIVFSTGWVQGFPQLPQLGPQSNFKSASPNLTTQINQTACNGATTTSVALWQAYQQLVAKNEPGALNLIVFFTDGKPNGAVSDFNQVNVMKNNSTCTYKLQSGHPMIGFIYKGAGLYRSDTDTLSSASNSLSTLSTTDTNGCYFRSSTSNVYKDTNLPIADAYGNRTNGPNRYVSVDLSQASDVTQSDNAALNAADAAVMRIRADTNLGVIIYAIGYDGGGSDRPDKVWMARIANDPSSQYYNAQLPAGMYVATSDSGNLNDAFTKVASEILRLSN